jgi:hypothetical protein
MQVRVATVNEQERTVEAILSTESRVEVYDWRRGEVIEEILVADAADIPRQLPLLNVHNRYSIDDVLGSVKSITVDDVDGTRSIVGRLEFAEGDEASDRAWNKVRHQRPGVEQGSAGTPDRCLCRLPGNGSDRG